MSADEPDVLGDAVNGDQEDSADVKDVEELPNFDATEPEN
jgi:hypothetical protein